MSAPQKAPPPGPCLPPSIEAFERLEIDPGAFDHTAHMFIAWSYLQQFDLLTSIERYRATLRKLTAKLGVPGKFHETITWFYLVVIAERMQSSPAPTWAAFAGQNQDLFSTTPSIIGQFYSAERLQSDLARKQFVLPDRAATPVQQGPDQAGHRCA